MASGRFFRFSYDQRHKKFEAQGGSVSVQFLDFGLLGAGLIIAKYHPEIRDLILDGVDKLREVAGRSGKQDDSKRIDLKS